MSKIKPHIKRGWCEQFGPCWVIIHADKKMFCLTFKAAIQNAKWLWSKPNA